MKRNLRSSHTNSFSRKPLLPRRPSATKHRPNRVVVHLQVIILDQFQPSSISHVEVSLSEDILEALVICIDVAASSHQVMPLDFQGVDDGCQL
jgi:hypothetical protein